ncbi:nitroreductase family deazaflavin-dependent oxidoreductase [Agromyces binzhouensis]|uniref:nitroreductase family deazaflavin-dependent oxidoreductase n=1 Tax=Agromyces binzhouensis TaxID=1817495 RepID=UPI003645B7BB
MPTVLQLTRSVVAPITRTRLFRMVAPVVLPPIEAVLGALSGGRLQLASLLVPSLVLHTVGARSGAPRDVHLMYTPDGHGRAIVAGTSFARDRHPGWTYNLMANPDASITVRDRTFRVRATRVPAAERDAAWARIEAQWPGYRGYERDSGRVVRLFVLRPVAEAAVPPPDPARSAGRLLDAPSASD